MNFRDIKDLENDPDIAQALGNMIIAWTHADNALMVAMCAICGIEPNQAMMGYYRIPTFESRIRFLTGMIEGWDTDKFDPVEVAKAIKAISDLSGTRNNWVHNIWSRNKETGELVVFNMRAEVGKGRLKPVKAHDIDHHAKTVVERADQLMKLLPGIL